MKIFYLPQLNWPFLKEADNLGEPGSYPLSNEHFDPELGNKRLDEFLEELVLCDTLGFDGVCFQENHGNGAFNAFSPSTHIMAAAISRVTERLSIALTGTVLPLHNPLTVAEELAMLTHLTKGRLIWGALRGIPTEYLAYNVNPAESQARFREAYDLIVKALSSVGPIDFDGTFYRVRDFSLWPRPYHGLPRIWMACNSMDNLDFAIERRTYVATGPVDNQRMGVFYQRGREIALEKSVALPEDWDEWFAGFAVLYVDETDQKARAVAEKHLPFYTKSLQINDIHTSLFIPGYNNVAGLNSFIEGIRGAGSNLMRFELDEGIDRGTFIVGGPESVIQQIKRKKDEGNMNVLVAHFRFGDLPHELAVSNIQIFAEEVLPKVTGY